MCSGEVLASRASSLLLALRLTSLRSFLRLPLRIYLESSREVHLIPLGQSAQRLGGDVPEGAWRCVGESLGDVPDFRLDAYPEALLYFSLNILG